MNLFSYSKKLQIDAGRRLNKKHVLTEEIWRYFDKKIPWSEIRLFVNQKGYQYMWEIFEQYKKNYSSNGPKYFWGMVNRVKVNWK